MHTPTNTIAPTHFACTRQSELKAWEAASDVAQHAAITPGSAAGSELSDETASRNGGNQSIGALALGGMSLADYVGVVHEYPNLVADARAVFKVKS